MAQVSSARAFYLVGSVGILYVVWGLIVSLQPSFYPSEAELKGARPSQYGLVFGTSNLMAFITAPLFGRFGHVFGAKYLYNIGAFVQAFSCLAFGFLKQVDDVTTFLGLSYFLRFICGIADAACWGSVVSILMKIFPNHVTSIASSTEMLFGLGYMIGPAIGAGLYSIGGFSLPYFVVGSMALIMAITLAFIVPKVQTDIKAKEINKSKTLTFAAIAKHPAIFVPFFDNFLCTSGSGMIESMLEPHIKNVAGLTQTDVGITFFILGAFYMVTSVTTGVVCDKINHPVVASIIGNICLSVGFLFVGPAPLFQVLVPTSLSIKSSGAVLGTGFAMVTVSTFGRSQAAAIRNGYNDDLDTYMFISNMWTSSFFFGNFLGPTLSGIFVDKFGFRFTTFAFFVFFAFNIFVDILELFVKIYNYKGNSNEAINYKKLSNVEI